MDTSLRFLTRPCPAPAVTADSLKAAVELATGLSISICLQDPEDFGPDAWFAWANRDLDSDCGTRTRTMANASGKTELEAMMNLASDLRGRPEYFWRGLDAQLEALRNDVLAQPKEAANG